jgi:hypothetical protein
MLFTVPYTAKFMILGELYILPDLTGTVTI